MNLTPQNDTDLGGTRVQLRPELRCSLQQVGGQAYYLLEDPLSSRFYRLGSREWRFASLLDGRRTLREVVRDASERLGSEQLSTQEALGLCRWLINSQLAEVTDSAGTQTGNVWRTPQSPRAWLTKTNPLFLRIPLCNPNRFLNHVLPFTRWLLSPACFAIWVVVCLIGAYQVATHWPRFSASMDSILASDNWLYLIGTWVGLKGIHELFHGLVCKKYGGVVPRCGVMLILFSPVAFVDVTSSWRFRSKWQRIFTSAAGMYVEFFVAAVAAIVWSQAEPGRIAQLCHNVIIMASVSTLLFNGNFLMRFDGYYILSDLLDLQNLYPSGQHYLRYLVRRYLLGVSATPPRAERTRLALVKAYGIAALIWRVIFYTGILVVAAGLFHGAGIALAILSGVLWFGLPTVDFCRYLLQEKGPDAPSRKRFAAVCALGAAAMAAFLCLPWPGGISAPAVVEYAPLTIVRSESSGFVQDVAVQAGDPVTPGQVLAVLHNPQLEEDLAELELEIRKSQLRGRMQHRDRELAKYFVERKTQETLEEKRQELLRQVANLTIRATTSGRVLGRDIDNLVGQYFDVGQRLMAVGLENQKELQVSIHQADVEFFRRQPPDSIYVRTKGRSARVPGARLTRINPRATLRLPHAALAATTGGPLAVKARAEAEANAPTDEQFELPRPRFTAIVAVPAEASGQLRAGELARVRFGRSGESIGAHLRTVLQRFLDLKAGRGDA